MKKVAGHSEAAAVKACRRLISRFFCNSPLLQTWTVPWLMDGSCRAPLFPISVPNWEKRRCDVRIWFIGSCCVNKLPIILLTENFLGLTGRARDSISNFSKILYKFGEFSATETSQNPTLCEAASEAPSVSGICKGLEKRARSERKQSDGMIDDKLSQYAKGRIKTKGAVQQTDLRRGQRDDSMPIRLICFMFVAVVFALVTSQMSSAQTVKSKTNRRSWQWSWWVNWLNLTWNIVAAWRKVSSFPRQKNYEANWQLNVRTIDAWAPDCSRLYSSLCELDQVHRTFFTSCGVRLQNKNRGKH